MASGSEEFQASTTDSPRRRLPALKDLAADLPASLVVFLVAVPLSMGIALASGAPIISGLVTAAIGGIVVGILGGAPLQVSGPAAGLAVLVFDLVAQHGFPALGAMVLAGGVLQIALGIGRVARGALAISPAVIHGMLAGIGVQIALAQVHVLLGGEPQSSAIANVRELPRQLANLHGPATLLGAVTVAILVLWPLVPVKAIRKVPAALVGVVAVTLLGLGLGLDVPRVELPSDLRSAIIFPTLPKNWGAFAIGAVTIAFVASAESLLCAVATDKLHAGKRANLDRELFAQGVGNAVSGLIGGLPITGVIVRSTANISAGAKTRLSALLHGVWVVVALTLAGTILTKIPLSALAALLVVVGAKLVNPQQIRSLAKHRELSTFLLTLAGVVGVNLLAGIGIGVAWACLRLLRRRAKVGVSVEKLDGKHLVRITGVVTFPGVPTLLRELGKLPPGGDVDVDLDVDMVDHAGLEALHDWRESYEQQGGKVDIDQSHVRSSIPGQTPPPSPSPLVAVPPVPASSRA